MSIIYLTYERRFPIFQLSTLIQGLRPWRSTRDRGKANREGISLMQLNAMFPTEEAATAWIESLVWPNGRHCPHCGCTETVAAAPSAKMPYRCTGCQRTFSARIGTALERSRVSMRQWVFAIYLEMTSLKGVSSMKLHRDIEVTQKTAWFMLHRIREAWGDLKETFDGPVEANEGYFGGRRENMSNAKRKALAGTGRGTVGKTAVVGVKDRATNEVRAKVVADTTSPTLQGFVRALTAPGATVYTDEATTYAGLGRDFDHEAVNHSVAEYVRGQAHTNGMESFWSMLKRAHKGVYHKLSAKHLDRYVREFDTLDQMGTVVVGMVGKWLMYGQLIADNGLASGARS